MGSRTGGGAAVEHLVVVLHSDAFDVALQLPHCHVRWRQAPQLHIHVPHAQWVPKKSQQNEENLRQNKIENS